MSRAAGSLSPVSGVILAAGRSSRFGSPKQLLVLNGRPLVRRIADEALATRLAEVIVVVGSDAQRVRAALTGADVRIVENPDYAGGQSTSVRAGLGAVSPDALGAMFMVTDQPGLTAALIDQLLAVFVRTGGPIVVPIFAGRRGSPVTFARGLFPELSALEGDTGGRPVVAAHRDDIVAVPLDSDAPLMDIDTPEELRRWRAERPGE